MPVHLGLCRSDSYPMTMLIPSSTASIREFKDCRNIADGAVIILASGMSAKDFPLGTFSHVPVIAMNGSIAMLRDAGIRPFFYACSDRGFARQQPELFSYALANSERLALWEDQFRAHKDPTAGEVYFLKKAENIPFWKALFCNASAHHVRHRFSFDKRRRSLGFSRDLQYGFFDARTVAYLALQIAYHAGFTRAFLVGVDLNQAGGRFYEKDHGYRSPCGLDEYTETRIFPSLRLTTERVVDDRFAIFNLSAISKIPDAIIPRIDLKTFKAMIESQSPGNKKTA